MLTVFLLCTSSSRLCSVHLASLTLACQVSLVCDTRESWHARLHGASTRAPEDLRFYQKFQSKRNQTNQIVESSIHMELSYDILGALSCYRSRSLLALLAVLSCSSCSSSNSAVWFRICQAFDLVWKGGG